MGTDPQLGLLGRYAEVQRTVGPADTADALGSGDVPVLGTPRLLAWLEAATVAALRAHPGPPPMLGALAPGRTSVGTEVQLTHRLPSPVGSQVTCAARVVALAGPVITFEVTASHDTPAGPAQVAAGRITRAVVDRARFLDRRPG